MIRLCFAWQPPRSFPSGENYRSDLSKFGFGWPDFSFPEIRQETAKSLDTLRAAFAQPAISSDIRQTLRSGARCPLVIRTPGSSASIWVLGPCLGKTAPTNSQGFGQSRDLHFESWSPTKKRRRENSAAPRCVFLSQDRLLTAEAGCLAALDSS